MKKDTQFVMGNMMLAQGRFDDARKLFIQYLDESKNEPPNQNTAIALQDIGICYKKQGRLEDALSFYQRALELSKRLNLQGQVADNISNIGVIYKNQGLQMRSDGDMNGFTEKLRLAEKCYLEAKEIDRKANNPRGLANDLNNLGIIYRHMLERSKAIGAYKESIKVAEKIGDKVLVGKAEMNIGTIYNDSKSYDEGIPYLEKALVSMSHGGTDQAYAIAVVKYNLGLANFEKGNLRESKKYFHEASDLLNQMQINDDALTRSIKQYLQKM